MAKRTATERKPRWPLGVDVATAGRSEVPSEVPSEVMGEVMGELRGEVRGEVPGGVR